MAEKEGVVQEVRNGNEKENRSVTKKDKYKNRSRDYRQYSGRSRDQYWYGDRGYQHGYDDSNFYYDQYYWDNWYDHQQESRQWDQRRLHRGQRRGGRGRYVGYGGRGVRQETKERASQRGVVDVPLMSKEIVPLDSNEVDSKDLPPSIEEQIVKDEQPMSRGDLPLSGNKVPTSEEEETVQKVTKKPSKQKQQRDYSEPKNIILHGKQRDNSRQKGNRKGGKKVVRTAQSDELSQQLTAGTYECMICCDSVRERHEIWSCVCCYHIFHLRCISRWARSLAAALNEEKREEGWRCPGCQNPSSVVPSVYKCFCGRVNNPAQRRGKGDMTVPHSCGEPCKKKLAISEDLNCNHKCHQLCHPGPCPPCPVTITRYCPCGKTSSRVRCSQYSVLPSCDKSCDKMLDCGLHKCILICHEGACSSCDVSVELLCYCKREKKSFLCGDIGTEISGVTRKGFSCGRICNRSLSCGNHTCESHCHPGDCSPCSLVPSVVSHCPCGATPISSLLSEGVVRTSCLDDIPTCNKQCFKPLPCTIYCTDDSTAHLCSSPCHIGECPPCTLTSDVLCKCGRTVNKVPCSEVEKTMGFVCNRVCRKKLSCGRHHCQKKCCTSDYHDECQRICGRKFDCGKHTCPDLCHPGRCGPCLNISYEELSCHCGGEVMLPPIPCGGVPPTCFRPCARPHSCNHPVTHSCHSDEQCPPCTFLIEKMCMGEHTVRRFIPCYTKEVSCGRPCGKPLPCGMHTCRKTCHKGSCFKEDEKCTQPCLEERKYCSHPCNAPCHYGNACPDTQCRSMVTLKCQCGLRTEQTVCLSSSAGITSQAFQKLHSQDLGAMMRELQNGQTIRIESVSLKNLRERRLECNEECAQYERNRNLAEALELSDVDYSPHTIPEYSAYLQDQARVNPSFIDSLESILRGLVETAKKEETAKYNFKPMKRDNRRTVHELAAYYGCTTTSYDAEPVRNVVVMATKKSFVPFMSLSRVVESNRLKPMPPPAQVSSKDCSLVPDLKTETKTVPDYFNDDI